MQPRQQFGGRGQVEGRRHSQLLDVEIRLVEPVEQHKAVRAGPIDLRRHVSQRGVARRQLHGDRNPDRVLHGLDNIDRLALDLGARDIEPGGDAIDVQFDRVGTSLLHQPRVLQPATCGRSVQRRNDRHVHRAPSRDEDARDTGPCPGRTHRDRGNSWPLRRTTRRARRVAHVRPSVPATICSSNSDRKTIAGAPASSRRRTESSASDRARRPE